MKRHIAPAAVLLAVTVVLFLYPLIAPPVHRIDEAHLAMIRPGMTEADVEGIFGIPAGAYDWAVANDVQTIWLDLAVQPMWNTPKQVGYTALVFTTHDLDLAMDSWTRVGYFTRTWTGRHGTFRVTFDSLGRVSHTGTFGETRIDPPWKRWWRQWKSR